MFDESEYDVIKNKAATKKANRTEWETLVVLMLNFLTRLTLMKWSVKIFELSHKKLLKIPTYFWRHIQSHLIDNNDAIRAILIDALGEKIMKQGKKYFLNLESAFRHSYPQIISWNINKTQLEKILENNGSEEVNDILLIF